MGLLGRQVPHEAFTSELPKRGMGRGCAHNKGRATREYATLRNTTHRSVQSRCLSKRQPHLKATGKAFGSHERLEPLLGDVRCEQHGDTQTSLEATQKRRPAPSPKYMTTCLCGRRPQTIQNDERKTQRGPTHARTDAYLLLDAAEIPIRGSDNHTRSEHTRTRRQGKVC